MPVRNTFRTLLIPFILMAATAASISCQTSPIAPTDGSATGQAGSVVGKVTAPNGQPLSKATVFTDNTVFKNRGSQTTTNADGTYQIALVSGLGQWVVKGYILKEYNGRVYKILLHPENDDSFRETEKPVRNFQWKLQGRVPDLSLNLYYGGTAELLRDPNDTELLDTENIEFTFQPDGPLIDGSVGQVLKLRCGAPGSNSHNMLRDIPLGRYIVSAVHKPTGKVLKVTDALHDGTYRPTATLEFYGTESATRVNTMGIGFTAR